MKRYAQSGFSLAETLIAIIVGSLVLASVLVAIVHQQRFYLVVGDITETRRDVEQVDKILAPELLPLNPSVGDIVYAGSDSLRMRVFRGVYSVCDKKLMTDVHLTVRRLTPTGRSFNGDSALVYSRGTLVEMDDDHWKSVKINAIDSGTCSDGATGWTAIVPGLVGLSSQIPIGAPVRVFAYASYWIGQEDGYWVLKSDVLGSPRVLGGRLMPVSESKSDVLSFQYRDDEGDPTSNPNEVVDVQIAMGAVGDAATTRGGDVYEVSRRRVLRLRNAEE